MKTIIDTAMELLRENERVSDYKINSHRVDSYELYFVKGKLETVRSATVREHEVTVYVDHEEFRGENQFLIYPYTTEEDLPGMIDEAVNKALLINNKHFTLPENEKGSYDVESNFRTFHIPDLAAAIAQAVFEANTVENASLNSVEIFINEHYDILFNSRGVHKEQRYFDAMLETIPTYNGEQESVELYHQYNFSSFDRDTVVREVRDMLLAVKARYEAIKPDFAMDCPVILNKQEVSQIMRSIAGSLNFSSVYSRSNLFKKGDAIQEDPTGDKIGITMAGEVKGNIRSRKYDADGLSLKDQRIVDGGKAVNYYGSNRHGQYLGETPTGALQCMLADAGSVPSEAFAKGPYLEIISMSGLQVDFYSDYIGGEVRLAYYHNGETVVPVTGISVTGQVREVLNSIRLSSTTATYNGYTGPEKAILSGMKIF